VWWQAQDRKVLKRINTPIRDVERNGNEGIGKPEPLPSSPWPSSTAAPHVGTTLTPVP